MAAKSDLPRLATSEARTGGSGSCKSPSTLPPPPPPIMIILGSPNTLILRTFKEGYPASCRHLRTISSTP